MSSLSSLWIKKETLKTLLDTVEKKGEKGVDITISMSDETNEWEQNVSAFVSQTQEQREAKVNRFYVGNGKVFWTDGTIKKYVRKEDTPAPVIPTPHEARQGAMESDLPF